MLQLSALWNQFLENHGQEPVDIDALPPPDVYPDAAVGVIDDSLSWRGHNTAIMEDMLQYIPFPLNEGLRRVLNAQGVVEGYVWDQIIQSLVTLGYQVGHPVYDIIGSIRSNTGYYEFDEAFTAPPRLPSYSDTPIGDGVPDWALESGGVVHHPDPPPAPPRAPTSDFTPVPTRDPRGGRRRSNDPGFYGFGPFGNFGSGSRDEL